MDGTPGEVYNAANEATCSLFEMEVLLAENVPTVKPGCGLKKRTHGKWYAPTLYMNLNAAKLRALGWEPMVGLEELFYRTIEEMKKACG